MSSYINEVKTLYEICRSTVPAAAILIGLLFPLGHLFERFIRTDESIRIQKFVFLLAIGSCLAITAAVWIYVLGGSWSEIRVASLWLWILGFASCLIRVMRFGASYSRNRSSRRIPIGEIAVVIVLAASCLAMFVFPRTYDGTVTSRQLIGPDALGYLNASAAILEDGSLESLKNRAIAESGFNSLDELFSWDILGVYQIPQKSLSIKTEFVVGANRIGFPSIVAQLTEVTGFEKLLTNLYVTSWVFVVAAGTLLWSLLKSFGYSNQLSLVASLVSITNINLLVGFHEGGVVQAFILFASIAFATAFVHESLTVTQRILLFATAFLFSISSYIDMFVVYVVTLAAVWLIAKARDDSEAIRRTKNGLSGLVLASILMAPMMARLPGFLLRRAADARQAGWPWNSWSELGGILGITNPYLSVPDSIIAQILLIGLMLVIYEAWNKREVARGAVFSFSLGVLAICGGFYLYSRYFMGHTNYQWFKFVGNYLGPLALVLVLSCLPKNSADTYMWSWAKKSVFLAIAVFALTVSTGYAQHYWAASVFVDPATVKELSEPEARAITSRYVVFGRYDWQEIGLTPFWPAAFLNRSDLGVRPNVPLDSEVGLMVHIDSCPQWNCLDRVPSNHKIGLGGEYLILDLNLVGKDVAGLTPYMQWRKVNRSLRLINAPFVERDWTNFSDELSYVE